MKRLLFTLALLLYAASSFAQKQKTESTETKHPCLLPVLELYNEQKGKLPGGAIPSGKITLRLQKNQACTEGVKYEVLGIYLVAVRGYRPMAVLRAEGNTIDLSEIESNFHAGDRLYIELQKVKYTTDNGKTGEFSYSHNWLFKQTQK